LINTENKCFPWYEQWFNDHYLHVYAHRDEQDAQMQAGLIAEIFPPEEYPEMLDLCCGEGRHARIFHEMGYSVTGIDLSCRMIEAARDASPEGICYAVSDMRNIQWENRFDIAVNLFTSFGYFSSEEEDGKVLEAVYRSLSGRGCFWIDFMNREYVIRNMEPYSSRVVEETEVEEKREISSDGKRVIKEIVLSCGGNVHRYRESVRMYTRNELKNLAENRGFSVTHEFGDYTGGPYSDESPRLIFAARKHKR